MIITISVCIEDDKEKLEYSIVSTRTEWETTKVDRGEELVKMVNYVIGELDTNQALERSK